MSDHVLPDLAAPNPTDDGRTHSELLGENALRFRTGPNEPNPIIGQLVSDTCFSEWFGAMANRVSDIFSGRTDHDVSRVHATRDAAKMSGVARSARWLSPSEDENYLMQSVAVPVVPHRPVPALRRERMKHTAIRLAQGAESYCSLNPFERFERACVQRLRLRIAKPQLAVVVRPAQIALKPHSLAPRNRASRSLLLGSADGSLSDPKRTSLEMPRAHSVRRVLPIAPINRTRPNRHGRTAYLVSPGGMTSV